jgi:hypothetical protein
LNNYCFCQKQKALSGAKSLPEIKVKKRATWGQAALSSLSECFEN